MRHPSSEQSARAGVAAALKDLQRRVHESAFPLAVPGVAEGIALRSSVENQIRDYLLPRIASPDSPLLVVVGGSTGAGKSTLVNSVLGTQVSAAGVRRPTTQSPVLVHHPEDAEYFRSDAVLPTLVRSSGQPASGKQASGTPATEAGRMELRLVADASLPRGLALLDSPDIDSVREDNRLLARQLLDAADLWLFVTTAARYADAVPWRLLKESADRGTTVSLVLDRVPPQANREVRHHLSALLAEAGLGSSPIFTVPELELESGLVPAAAVFPVRSWILNLGSSERARRAVVERTLAGALASLPPKVRTLADSVAEQEVAHQRLRDSVEESFAGADTALRAALTSGEVLRGEVLARWQDFVGTGQFFRGLEPSVARIRDRITASVTGKRDAAGPLETSLLTSAAVNVRAQLGESLRGLRSVWRSVPEGAALLEAEEALTRLPADFDTRLERTLGAWSTEVKKLVKEVGQSKRAKARIMSFGVDGVGAVLMLAVFAGQGTPTAGGGTDPAAASGAGSTVRGPEAVAGQLLDSIFGGAVTRDLVGTVRADLVSRTGALLAECREPFDRALDTTAVTPRAAGILRSAADRLEEHL